MRCPFLACTYRNLNLKNLAQSIKSHCGEHRRNQNAYVYHFTRKRGPQEVTYPEPSSMTRPEHQEGKQRPTQLQIRDYVFQSSLQTSALAETIDDAPTPPTKTEPTSQCHVPQGAVDPGPRNTALRKSAAPATNPTGALRFQNKEGSSGAPATRALDPRV